MRWRFPNPNDAVEIRRRQLLGRAIEGWWAEFERKQDDLDAVFSKRSDWDLPGWMHQYLHAIDPSLMWEFGPAVSGGRHRLVITPESKSWLRPLVSEILRLAPRIEGWEFYPYRPPESLDRAKVVVKARTGGDISDSGFAAERGEGNRIHLTFYASRGSDKAAFFAATETLLGEEILDKWIGAIHVAPMRFWKRKARLDALRARVSALIDEAKSELPAKPLYDDSDDAKLKLSLFKITRAGGPETDYPSQSDMFLGKSMLPEMWQTAHSEAAFASERFSRHGETFCYVKVDGREGLSASRFADKAAIEDALDAALMPAGLGCHVGGGTGNWYSYVDLALVDVDKGCEVARDVLRSGNVPKRSWIQFFDDVWAAEWIGVYDDTPPPPMDSDIEI